ncbi:MAG TPA: translation elongation factor Ts, partial [Candidatus Ozemobacteraceae bacterium]|nr:translation elongation factor Ts [Candidatus Ozemobacteraceae bacterium]
LASADGKADRKASMGLVTLMVAADKRSASIIEANCETDFVAKNENFISFAQTLAELQLSDKNIKTPADLTAQKTKDGQPVEEMRKLLIAKIGENMLVGRTERLEIPSGHHGLIDLYVHGDKEITKTGTLGKNQFGMGAIGVLVCVEAANPDAVKHDDLQHFAHEVALQACAMKARFLSRDQVPADVVAREKDVILGQIKEDPKNANKPENVLAKIVEGRLDKFYKERCLLEQIYVKDDTKTIKDLMNDMGKKMGGEVKITAFRRWALGEQG